MDIDLKYAIENGIIDSTHIEKQIAMKKKEELLSKHPHKIWQNKKGEWYTYINDANGKRILRRSKSLEKLQQIIVDNHKEIVDNPTVKEVFEKWNTRRIEFDQIEKSTFERNNYIFQKHFDEFGNKRISYITHNDWCDFLEAQVPKHNLSPRAYGNLKTIVKGIIKYARREKLINYTYALIEEDISENIRLKKVVKRNEEDVYFPEEIEKIKEYILKNINPRNLAIYLILVTGMRIGEVAALKNSEISDKSIFVCRTEGSYKENHKLVYVIKEYPKTEAGVRDILLPESELWLLKTIKRINPFGEFTFFEENKGRINTRKIRERLGYICDSLNIPYRSPHKIRKTYASKLLDSGADLNFITKQLGHSHISTSEKFYHRDMKSVKEKLEILKVISS